MTAKVLVPNSELLTAEYVLAQAWKKTANHIRYHNWYSDTLELDRAATNLPRFLAELADELKARDFWTNDPLRIVPAPKSQRWHLRGDTTGWGPIKPTRTAAKMRPLAHVSLKDQIAATALMLCLADRVETSQGDPRGPITTAESRRRVISYGNRLFCESVPGGLRHPWGSAKLYREYYQDYRTFLSRPEAAIQEPTESKDLFTVIVHSDLDKFYDRVRPELLAQKLDGLKREDDDPTFFVLARRVLDWEWSRKDTREVTNYAKQAELDDFTRVALPQGLVSSGFFANLVLLDFDEQVRTSLLQDIVPGVRLEDACRYVDDLRIVLTVRRDRSLSEVEEITSAWIQGMLDKHAFGLRPSKDKTKAATLRDDKRPIVLQSRKMQRIQAGISCGFDAIAGLEILDAIQGLIRSQQRYTEERIDNQEWSFAPVADVRDATVSRFAAGRFRRTYRSLRPLLEDNKLVSLNPGSQGDEEESRPTRIIRSQDELDDEARAFALGLIENWVEDPSNVRLLRIGLDLWPADDILKRILEMLRPYSTNGGRRAAAKRVAWYCLAEIFRAGATETGFVDNADSLPSGIDIANYRSVLWYEGLRLAALPASTLPWYLKQQVALFLAANASSHDEFIPAISGIETKHYRELIRFLRDEGHVPVGGDFATLAILSRRAFRGRDAAVQLVGRKLGRRHLAQIADRDPSFAIELVGSDPDLVSALPPRLVGSLCLQEHVQEGWVSLSTVVLEEGPLGLLRNEMDILWFASKLMEEMKTHSEDTIIPSDVLLRRTGEDNALFRFVDIRIEKDRLGSADSMYSPPQWCAPDGRWRFQLGYLLRFILTARVDFTNTVRSPHGKEGVPIYRSPEVHWYQRMYGLFNGHSAFGDDWLPISDWVEQFLSALLSWPGCRIPETFEWVELGIDAALTNVRSRLAEVSRGHTAASRVLKVRISAPRLVAQSSPRPLRVCVMQTATPKPTDFTVADLTLSGAAIRKQHRNHLSAALAAVERMLDLRETHKKRDGRLDWLILPELSVHPDDVKTHLIPFARAHKAIILAGLTYEEILKDQPLVNSALWIIPTWSSAHGLQIKVRRQGKLHLAPEEQAFNAASPLLQGFRPCQWLVAYQWSGDLKDDPLWLTGSICYDATDLRLAAELRGLSDVFAIPALNRDVNTFDQMALALHYHMFQLVIVANNGLYGGSNAYAPFEGGSYIRQLFHLHGQPQAAMAFIEIDDPAGFIARRNDAKKTKVAADSALPVGYKWKFPPAGM